MLSKPGAIKEERELFQIINGNVFFPLTAWLQNNLGYNNWQQGILNPDVILPKQWWDSSAYHKLDYSLAGLISQQGRKASTPRGFYT